MKRLILIFFILFIILFGLLLGGYFYLSANGKDIVIQKVEQQLNKKIVFDEIKVSFPLTLEIKNLKVEDIGSFEKITCSLNPVYFLLKQVYFPFVEIVNPNIEIHSKAKNSFSLPSFGENKKVLGEKGASQEQDSKNNDFIIVMDRFVVRNGSFLFFNESEDEEKELFSLGKIDAMIHQVIFSQKKSLETNFDITAKLTGFDGRFNEDDLKCYGWVDFLEKDMKAKLQISGMGGQVGLLADLLSEKNDLTVKGKMNLAFTSKEIKKDSKTFEDFFVETLQSSGAHIDMKFDFKTKMDDFQIGEVSLSGMFKKEK
ncbi:MAG: AsmA family protein [Candidatus Omnitrophica bacterium]|nr:AsmA family protein [Candidatus Omnitrophota bacterium]